jgi:hypothetical protein
MPIRRCLRHCGRQRSGIAALILACWAIGLSWVFTNPPLAAPDEFAHYLKAIGVGRGELVGPTTAYPFEQGAPRAWIPWVTASTTAVDVPAGLSPFPLLCREPGQPAECFNRSRTATSPLRSPVYVGRYEPYPYILPGLLTHAATTPQQGVLWGRLGSAIPSLLLISLAIALVLGGSGGAGLPGVLVALSPMTFFLASELSPNGTEVAGGVCFAAALLRATREPRRPPGWVWIAIAAGGAVLAASRSLGPIWLGLDLLFIVALRGVRPLVLLVRRSPARAASASAVMGLALLATLLWEWRVQAHPPLVLSGAGQSAGQQLRDLRDMLEQGVGVFGILEVHLPDWVYATWAAMTAALVASAVALGSARERATLAAAIVAGVAVELAVWLFVIRPTGFGMQGRYVLAFWIILPLLAGDILSRRSRAHATSIGVLAVATTAVVAVLQVAAWYINGHHYAVNPGEGWRFLANASWNPPAGWLVWTLITAGGALLLVAGGVLTSLPTGGRPPATDPATSPAASASGGGTGERARLGGSEAGGRQDLLNSCLHGHWFGGVGPDSVECHRPEHRRLRLTALHRCPPAGW